MMKVCDIINDPDGPLRQKSAVVESVDDSIRRQMDQMINAMYSSHGIGLAANQVAMLNRVIVMDLGGATWHFEEEKDGIKRVIVDDREEIIQDPCFFVNPEVIWQSEERTVYPEGCLSVPGQFADVERPAQVRVKYLDYNGKEQEMEADGLLSHCIQHEMDHLDGILFIDHLSKLKRDILVRKVRKTVKDTKML